jgi:transmembrane sensor
MKARAQNSKLRMRQLEEAAQWIVRLGAEMPSEEDAHEWLRWCDERSGNLEAFEDLQGDWRDLGAVTVRQSAKASSGYNPTIVLSALAAAIACAIVGVIFWWNIDAPSRVLESARQNRSATLPDGSSVMLSARTGLSVDFTGRERRLSLSRGEAYFQVQHDSGRPFTVAAGDLHVTAVGTAFDVRRERDSVIVTVAEGVVGIVSDTGRDQGGSAHWQASAGYQLTYDLGTRTANLLRVDPDRLLTWREGELAYVSTPLGTVIDDVNRYSERRIIIKDPKIARLIYSGTVFTASVDDWLKTVGVAFALQIDEAPGGELVIGPAQK